MGASDDSVEEAPEADDEISVDEILPDEELPVSLNMDLESSCHECVEKDVEIKGLRMELEKLKKELTVQRREREKQRKHIIELDASCSFFRADQQKCLAKKNLRGYTWSKETLRDALKIRFSGNCFTQFHS